MQTIVRTRGTFEDKMGLAREYLNKMLMGSSLVCWLQMESLEAPLLLTGLGKVLGMFEEKMVFMFMSHTTHTMTDLPRQPSVFLVNQSTLIQMKFKTLFLLGLHTPSCPDSD